MSGLPDKVAEVEEDDGATVVLPTRHTVRRIVSVLLAVIVAWLLWELSQNPNFKWGTVGEYLFNPKILSGLVTTLWLTAVCMILGVVLAIMLAIMDTASNPIVRSISRVYVWFFRGTPVLVQLIFWYNLAALFPTIAIGVPFLPPLWEGSANDLVTPYTAAILGLGLNEAAYMSEIVRAGLRSVDRGQIDAGRAFGMKPGPLMARIVIPQAMRVIIPPTGNETIGMLKTTSLVSVVALADLLYSAQSIYSRTYETIPLLIVVSLWYLAITSVMTVGQRRIEQYFGRGHDLPAARREGGLATSAIRIPGMRAKSPERGKR